jgi:hypothetical protein
MAVIQIFPSKDATLYSAYPDLNSGLDEIIEANTNFITGSLRIDGSIPQASRFLIQFSNSEIQNAFSTLVKTSSWDANLKVFAADVTGLSNTTTLAINAVAESWEMGTGLYYNNPPTTNGVSWIWRNYSGSTPWTTASFTPGTTGSYSTSSFAGGGVWYTGSQASQSFDYYSPLDINVNVRSIVNNWSSSTFNNYGFIIRQTQSQEFVNNFNQQVTLKYFSRDTNTIYPPALQISWNDFVFSTGSNNSQTILNTLPATITVAQNPGVFYSESINRFRINARPEYPIQLWTTSSVYLNNYYLPTASYYAIKDLETNEYIVNFDTIYTKLSADATSSYFDLYMNYLQPERYYTILIQSTINGSTIVFNDQYYFKVING